MAPTTTNAGARLVVDDISALPPLLTTKKSCELAQCSTRTLGRWCADGRIESVRPVAAGSGRRLIKRDSLLALLGLKGV